LTQSLLFPPNFDLFSLYSSFLKYNESSFR